MNDIIEKQIDELAKYMIAEHEELTIDGDIPSVAVHVMQVLVEKIERLLERVRVAEEAIKYIKAFK